MSRSRWRSALMVSSLTSIALVYLFVQAPPPLAASREEPGRIPIRAVFALLEHENDAARALWTSEIVNAGQAHGLVFDEKWRDDAVASGPLPALFLRETARQLERKAPGLRLFLGSSYPINTANRFSGEQAAHFRSLAETGAPQAFRDAATGLYTAMFADRAVVPACVKCHNEHAGSPKSDWALNDIMGATTWMYTDETVTLERALQLLQALRASIRAAYASFLAKAATFPTPPTVGDGWPRDGRQVPSEEVFMRELARRSSTGTLRGLFEPRRATEIAEAPDPPAVVAAPPPRALPGDVLVVRANRETKLVVERAGTQLVVARLRPGGAVSVTSPPPLRVRVHDQDAITLEYRGQPVRRAEVEIVTRDEDAEDR